MYRILIIAVLALLLAFSVRRYEGSQKSLQAAQASLAQAELASHIETSVAVTASVRQDATRKRVAHASATLGKALATSPDWASQPVPTDILDSLRDSPPAPRTDAPTA